MGGGKSGVHTTQGCVRVENDPTVVARVVRRPHVKRFIALFIDVCKTTDHKKLYNYALRRISLINGHSKN